MQELLYIEKKSLVRVPIIGDRGIFAWFGWSRTPGRMIFLTHGAIFAKFRGNNRIELRHCSLSNSQSIRKTM